MLIFTVYYLPKLCNVVLVFKFSSQISEDMPRIKYVNSFPEALVNENVDTSLDGGLLICNNALGFSPQHFECLIEDHRQSLLLFILCDDNGERNDFAATIIANKNTSGILLVWRYSIADEVVSKIKIYCISILLIILLHWRIWNNEDIWKVFVLWFVVNGIQKTENAIAIITYNISDAQRLMLWCSICSKVRRIWKIISAL